MYIWLIGLSEFAELEEITFVDNLRAWFVTAFRAEMAGGSCQMS